MDVYGYIRRSTGKQALTPEAQRDSIRAWIARTDGAVLKGTVEDSASGKASDSDDDEGGFSLQVMLEHRPNLLLLIQGLKRGDTLLVAKRDRIGRDALLLAMIERTVVKKGARLVSVAGEGTGTDDDPSQLLMRRMIDAFAEYERLIIRARTKTVIESKRRRREALGGRVPFGQQKYLEGDRKKLRDDPTEQAVIDRAVVLRSKGMTLREIAQKLAEEGLSPRKGGNFYPTQIKRMLDGKQP